MFSIEIRSLEIQNMRFSFLSVYLFNLKDDCINSIWCACIAIPRYILIEMSFVTAFKYKETSTHMYPSFYFRLNFNNMGHTRISGTEPSSVILSQTKKFKKVEKWCPKVPKQVKAKMDDVINPQNYNFNQF